MATRLFDGQAALDQRQAAAAELADALERFSAKPPDLQEPKLPFVTEAIKQTRKVFQDDRDPAIRSAAALVLGRLHLAAHAVYKPDDNAKDNDDQEVSRDASRGQQRSQGAGGVPVAAARAPGL